jgi:hypothetical protein
MRRVACSASVVRQTLEGMLTNGGFTVNAVSLATKRLKNAEHGFDNDVLFLEKKALQHGLDNTFPVVKTPSLHPFVATVHESFAGHYPLSFGPQHIWLLVMQGIAAHFRLHAERLRSKVVAHEGKEKIVVSFTPPFDWTTVFPLFLSEIKKRTMGDLAGLASKPFSVSTPVSTIASTVALMDCMQHYFEYVCETECGIPSIILEGTVEDWLDLQTRLKILRSFDDDPRNLFTKMFSSGGNPELQHWTKWFEVMEEAVAMMAETKAQVDKKLPLTDSQWNFWNSFYKYESRFGSGGGRFVSGHILAFFPYAKDRSRQYALFGGELNVEEFPSALAGTPFIWDNNGTEIPLEFEAGFYAIQ